MQLREHLAPDIKWDIQVKRVIHSGQSKFQQVELIESGPFGKVSTQPQEHLCLSCKGRGKLCIDMSLFSVVLVSYIQLSCQA